MNGRVTAFRCTVAKQAGAASLGLAVALIGLMTVNSLTAGSSEFVVETLDTERGLPSSTVTGLAQSPDGYLWLSTVNGIARFDGVHFRSFAGTVGPGQIVGGFNQVAVDKGGTVWVRSEAGEVLVRGAAGFGAASSSGKVVIARNLLTASDGSVWLTLADGTMARGAVGKILDCPQTGKLGGFAGPPVALASDRYWAVMLSGELIEWRDGKISNPLRPPGAVGMRMVGLAGESSGAIWLLGEEGLWKWQAGEWTSVDLPRNATKNFQGISAGANGYFWIWSRGAAWRFDRGEWLQAEATWAELTKERGVSASLVDEEGSVWFSTGGAGLVILSRDGRVTQLSLKQGLPSNHVLALMQDHEGTIWAATRRGLARIKQRQMQVISWSEESGESVATGLAEAADGTMWIGRDAGAVWRMSDRPGAVPELFAAAPRSVRAMVFDRARRLWVGTVREGLWRVEEDRLVRVGEGQLPRDEARTLLADSRGRLWIGTTRGLFSSVDGKIPLHPGPPDSGTLDVRALVEDGDGSIFIGTRGNGLFRWRAGEAQAVEPKALGQPLTIWSLHLDAAGNLWIGTDGAGLLRWCDGRLDYFNRTNGLPVETIYSILEDGNQNLWMGTPEGIFRVKKSECDTVAEKRLTKLQPTVFTRSDGMPTLQCASGFQPNACRTRDGRLWFATDKGVVVVDPKGDKSPSPPPSVVIEEVSLQGKTFPAESGLRLGPRPRRIEFHYTALSFSAPERVRFRYRLEGEDREWIDAGTSRSAAFDALLPGYHEFTVSACNGDGIWNERGVSLKFIVVPIWWQTSWFKAGVTSCSVLLVAGVWWQIATRRLQRRLEDAKRQGDLERERSRIARDIHDELGASLTRIVMLSQPLDDDDPSSNKELSSIHKTARDLTRAMDEVVWAVNPRQDTLEGLVSYISLFAQEFVVASNVSCRLDLPEKLPATVLSAEARHNVFLAAKEALNNAVRHSKALEIRVGLKITDAGFTMEISDDGIGFDPSNVVKPRRGHGLQNMRDRLTSSGGSCEIASILKKGTTVSFIMPLAKTVGV